MRPLDEALNAERLEERSFRLVVEDGWQQGRGAYGGLVIGAMVRAAMVCSADSERIVRSVTAELLGPVLVGTARLVAEPLRQGGGVSAWRVRLLQSEAGCSDEAAGAPLLELCQAVVVFGRVRPGTPSWDHTVAPEIPDWRSVPVLPLGPPLAPTFTQHFEFRVTGTAPWTSATRATAAGFLRPKRWPGAVDAALIAALADVYWPSALAVFDGPRPTATVTFALECFGVDLDFEQPLFHVGRSEVAHEGYAVEDRELWTADGRLVARNHQVFAIIR